MKQMQSWAYDFDCVLDLDGMASAMNTDGIWKWQGRESYSYGDYLNTRPAPGVRVRIHQYPQTVGAGTQFTGPRESGFMALLEMADQSASTREQIDKVFRDLLDKIQATHVSAIEPYN